MHPSLTQSSEVPPFPKLRHFQTEAPEQPRAPKVSRGCKWLSSLRERLTLYSSPSCGFSAKLLHDVIYYHAVTLREEEGDFDAVVLAAKLSSAGYHIFIRTALGGGTACFRNLRHEFLTVRGRGPQEGMEFIIEPSFRSQFEIPHPTAEYQSVLAALPEMFVGTGSRLTPLVQVLTSSMLSKWLPARARDTSVGGPPDAPRSASHSSSSSRRGSTDTPPYAFAAEVVHPPLPISRQTSFSKDQWQPAGPPIYGASPENDSTFFAPSIHHARQQQQQQQQQHQRNQQQQQERGPSSPLPPSDSAGRSANTPQQRQQRQQQDTLPTPGHPVNHGANAPQQQPHQVRRHSLERGSDSASPPATPTPGTPVPPQSEEEGGCGQQQQPAAGRSPPRSLLSVKLQGSSPRRQQQAWQPLTSPTATPPTTPRCEACLVKTVVVVSGFGAPPTGGSDECPALGRVPRTAGTAGRSGGAFVL
ncbi:MAG: hypothetical protein WDW36_009237 [Sanguina aurantia]